MKKSLIVNSLAVIALLLPTLVLAQASQSSGASATTVSQGIGTFAGIINTFNNSIIKAVGTLFMSLAVVAFFWGIVQYVWGIRDGKVEAIKAGREFMVWALIALFVMFSMYGIVKTFQKMFGVEDSTITIPNVMFQGGGGGTTGNNGLGGGGTGGSGIVGGETGSGATGGGGTGGNNRSAFVGGSADNAGTGGAGSANANIGGDCATLGVTEECTGGNICVNFTCQPSN